LNIISDDIILCGQKRRSKELYYNKDMPKYRTLITTQLIENYGAHNGSGKFADGEACWKFKGGNQYLVSTDNPREANAVAFLVAYLRDKNTTGWKEVVRDWDYLSDEDWVQANIDDGIEEIDIEEYMGKSPGLTSFCRG